MGYKGKFSGEDAAREKRVRLCKTQKFTSLILLFYYLAILVPELVLRFYTAPQFGGRGLFMLLLFSLVPAFLAYAVTLLLPRKAAFIFALIFTGAAFFFYGSQQVYYILYQRYYIASSLGGAADAMQFKATILRGITTALPRLLLMMLPFLFLCIFGWRLLGFGQKGRLTFSLFLAAVGIGVHFLAVLILPAFGREKMSPYDLYHNTFDIIASTREFGMGASFRLDLHRYLFHIKETGALQPLETNVYTRPQPTNPLEPSDGETTAPTQPNPTGGLNILEIDFDRLIAEEEDEAIREMHQYFKSMTPSAKNEKTGAYQDCNLIFITAESFSHLAIDKELTPTLYKMQHEGIYFSNFYTPGWDVSTTDGEYVNLTGTIPKAGVWSMTRTANNSMPLVLSQQLKKLGYSARAYHNHTYTYYDRDVTFPNLGFDYKGLGNGLDVKDTWPESDLEMVDKTTSEFFADQPFYVYYLTVSGHADWNFNDSFIAYKNRELVAHLDKSEVARAYLAANIELDKAMELLLMRLEDAGLAENTLIVMVADHNPYSLSAEQVKELAGHDVDNTFEVYKNACIIYKKGMTPETIDEPCCNLDMLPTVSNLMGLDFDSRLYMGRDIFSDALPLVIFRDRSWITDKCFYNANTGEVTSMDGEPVSDAYVEEVKNQVYNKFTISSRILDYDYWRILFGDTE